MKKLANFLIVFGSGLAACGLSGWQMDTLWQLGHDTPEYWAQWLPESQIQLTLGVVLLVLGLILRKIQNESPPTSL
jgi:hypothetical protein